MLQFRRLLHLTGGSVILLVGASLGAQTDSTAMLPVAPAPGQLASPAQGVITVSSDSVDRLRLAQLSGTAPAGGLMLRSTSSLSDPRRYGLVPRPFTIVMPMVQLVSNSELPFGQNDGALWAGKGANARVLAGFTATFGPIRLVAIPELAYSSNGELSLNPVDTAFAPTLPASRSRFSSPFNVYPYSADVPYRFGDASFSRIYPGQSSITLTAGPIEVGGATENEWWGPALRNPLVLGDNAPGFPHAFLRTKGALTGLLGSVDARMIVGGLHESEYFDNDVTNDVRSISALAIAWRPRRKSDFTLGFTRAVIAPTEGYSDVPGALFDVFRNVGHPNARFLSDSAFVPGPDQIFSLFGRWAIPVYGIETYLEWARADFPISLRDLLEQPNHSRGYTAGLQWTRSDSARNSRFRIMGELTSVEQSSTYRYRPIGSFYTSRAVPQGFTNEGQVLGSGMGPGSSGGFLAADYFRSGFQFGLTFGRTRYNNDAFFLLPAADRCGHDVITYPGFRGSYANRFLRVGLDFAHGSRYNTFFQNKRGTCLAGGEGSDRTNNALSLTLATFGW